MRKGRPIWADMATCVDSGALTRFQPRCSSGGSCAGGSMDNGLEDSLGLVHVPWAEASRWGPCWEYRKSFDFISS